MNPRHTPAVALLVFVYFAIYSQSGFAEESFTSSEKQAQLLELYTSQGCSSSPAAEDFVNTLLDDKQLWDRVVPVCFHVNYWDFLGWKDAYARKKYVLRQKALATENGKTIYTPNFFINGKEWKQYFKLTKLPKQRDRPTVGVLNVEHYDGLDFAATFSSEERNTKGFLIHGCLLAFDIVSHVKAGENRGKTLTHQFVAVDLISKRTKTPNGHVFEQEYTFRLPSLVKNQRLGIAFWVTETTNNRPIQAVGGFLDEEKFEF